MTDYSQTIARSLKLKSSQVTSAIELLDGGNTVPFIARYRKEMTGTLDEEQLRQIQAEVERLRTLDERRATVLASITEQGKMTAELEEKINRQRPSPRWKTCMLLTNPNGVHVPALPGKRDCRVWRISSLSSHALPGMLKRGAGFPERAGILGG